MKTSPRWIAATLAGAATCRTRMPWERGLRREAMISRRVARGDVSAALPLPLFIAAPQPVVAAQAQVQNVVQLRRTA